MKIATWNVNSIKMRAEQVVAWLKSTAVDVLVMQETKTTDDAFPASLFESAGYDVVFDGQKTYNGVAMAVKKGVAEVSRITRGIPGYPDDQKRFIAADLTTQDDVVLTVAGVYVPNGQEVASAKYLYKLDWLAALTRWARLWSRVTSTSPRRTPTFGIRPTGKTRFWSPSPNEVR